MITPIKAVMNNSMVSNPVALNTQSVYNNALNYPLVGKNLNVKSNDNYPLSETLGTRLNIIA